MSYFHSPMPSGSLDLLTIVSQILDNRTPQGLGASSEESPVPPLTDAELADYGHIRESIERTRSQDQTLRAF